MFSNLFANPAALALVLPAWALEVLIKFGIAALLIVPFVSLVAMICIWGERKVAGRMQSRHGPMRVGGWHGWAQSLADGLKLVTKEDLIPQGADQLLFRLAPYFALAPAIAAFMLLAWSRDLSGLTREINSGVFLLLALLALGTISVILAGWASNNKWSVYGAMREACQMVSYEIPLGLAIITGIIAASAANLNMFDLSVRQSGGWFSWLVFHDPFNFLAFVIYYIAALASCKRAPFDLPESESELVAGYHTEYSGIRFSFFFFAEYAEMFLVSAIQTTLWLGAWYDPFGIVAHLERASAGGSVLSGASIAANLLGVTVFITKAALLIYVQMWLRWTLPRLRIDQVLHLCVKVLLPLAAINVLLAATYSWLLEPLPGVQIIIQVLLGVFGILLLAALAGLIAWAWMNRERSTFKVIYPQELPTLPGA